MDYEASNVAVSVLCITYNHEPYIAQALDGFVMQETDFSFEILVHDDASSDRTPEIIRSYEDKYPELVKPIYQTENQFSKGIRPNWKYNWPRARGKYLALCEGDDYWTDPHKLQRQVDLLESHPDYALCFHPVVKYFEEQGSEKVFSPPGRRERYRLADLLEQNFIATCSVMFRNHLFDEFPDWFWHVPAADLPLHVLNAQHGDIGYIDQVMAVHRIQGQGIWSHKPVLDRLRNTLRVQASLQAHLGPEYADRLNDTRAATQLRMWRAYWLQRDWPGLARHSGHLLFGAGLPLGSLLRAARRLSRSREQGE